MLVVFDLDGTVIDSSAALLGSHDVAWERAGLPRPSDEAILDLIGLPLLDTMKTLAPGHDPEFLAEVYSQAYVELGRERERLFDGMRALLDRPFRAAVATGKSQRGADRAVFQHGLSQRFEVVLGGDSVPRPKPHPDLLMAIQKATGCDALIMIGDTTYDLEMARSAGVEAIGVSWGHHAVDRLSPLAPVVDTVQELDQMLCERLGLG